MTTPHQSRREFLASLTAAGAVSLVAPRGVDARTRQRSIGANDRIRIGIIGCGDRGIGTEMASVRDHAKAENLEVIAVYDPYRVARENAAAKAKEWFGTDATQCRSVDELLGLADVDAVFISSPDHWHATHLEAATRARKHVYVEKPMAIEIGELNRAYTTAKASGAVIQAGTQLTLLFRVSLSGSWRPFDRLAFVGEVQSEDLTEVRTYAAYVRLRPIRSFPLDIQAGRIPPVFGSFGRRTYGTDNPVIG